ncbi:MAG: FG-GAP repeat protein, partial [Acidobacteria bacterium]|nr:FG-GAP repeat protein [Acidobacteriota bacterium]
MLVIAGRQQAPAPDTRPTFAAAAPAAILGAAEAPAAAPTTFADLPADTRTGIVSAMRAAQPISDSTALLLHDRTQQLAATVGEAETTISGRDGARVRFSQAALGRDAELHPLSGAVPLGLHTPQVRLGRSTGATAVEEWWRNSPAGIEQGFTLHTRPEGTGPLRLQQTITSTLTAHLTDGDTALRFSDGESERLRFGGLIAYDATGRSLPAVMRLTANHLAFVVDDTDAVFPVVIDPTWTQQAYLKASNTEASDNFAYRVAVSGDTIVVGAYLEDSNGTG